MSRTLARVLWLTAAAALATAGCSSRSEQSAQRSQQSTEGKALEENPQTASRDGDEQAQTAPVGNKDNNAPAKQQAGPSGVEAVKAESEAVADVVKASPSPAPALLGRSKGRRAGSGLVGGQITVGGDSGGNTEHYQDHGVSPVTDTADDRLSTFAIDVDTASYAIARRKLLSGQVPPAASVRVEEFVNYFRYGYAPPTDGAPFAVHMDAAPSPFSADKHFLRVGVQGKKLSLRERKTAHLTFLVDVSGSMQSPDKLGLAKRALRILVDNLKDGDTVSLVTYAGSTRVVLEPTGLDKKAEIVNAIEELTAGGSTAMSSGIQLAYNQAARNLGEKSVSRVIVLSDGDANVGRTNHEAILDLIHEQKKKGVTLSTIGFGMGNYKDHLMEQLANKGNGNYYYIDGLSQARRVFQEQLGGTLEVVAKDVKIQVEFDPDAVKSYRLIGYENRDVADRDFRNDNVDAGEIGAGHTVTALYEVTLSGKSSRLATVRVRAKRPKGEKANEWSYPFPASALTSTFDSASNDFRFAVAVAATAEILRKSPHTQSWSLSRVANIARGASSADNAERQEFLSLLSKVEDLRPQLAVNR